MIDVNVTATSFVVVSSSTQQNYTVSSDNTIFTVTNVTPNYTVSASGLTITFQATGGNGYFDQVVANTGTFQNLFTEYFTLNGLAYPHSRGLYGQVLATNGTDYANWVNLGDLNFWSLNSDLLTNSYNIVTGVNSGDPNPQLTLGSGVTNNLKSYIRFNEVLPSATTGTITILGNTTFQNAVAFNNGFSGVAAVFTATTLRILGTSTFAGTATFGGITTFAGTATYASTATFADVRIKSVNTLSGWTGTTSTYVNIAPGIRFADGTILTSTNAISEGATGVSAIYAGQGITTSTTTATSTLTIAVIVSLNTATTATIGGVVIGPTLYINTQTAVVNVNTATTATAGVMKIGFGLVLNTFTNAVDVSFTGTTFLEAGRGLTTATNTTTGALIFNLNTATTATFGGVVIGTSLYINTQTAVVNVNTATTATLGGVRIGTSLYINTQTAVVNVNTATTATAGIVRIGDGISVNTTGTITLTTASTTQLGGIRVGANLNMDNEGYLSAVGSGLSAGSFNLTATSYTNSVPIYNGVGNTSTGLIIGDNNINLFANTSTGLIIGNNRVDLFANTATLTLTQSRSSLASSNWEFSIGASLPNGSNQGWQIRNPDDTDSPYMLASKSSGVTISSKYGLFTFPSDNTHSSLWAYGPNTTQESSTLYYSLNRGQSYGNSISAVMRNANQYLILGDQKGIELINGSGSNLLLSATTASIQYSNAGPALTLLATTATLSVSTASYVQITTSSIAITSIATTASNILLRTSEVVLGDGQYQSQLRVQRIYNYAGTYAPVFPAGVQFGDNSVQTTAWQPDELAQRFVDFQNPLDPAPY
jgi:hypothetical protein